MAETVRSELPNLWRSMNEPRACRYLYQICPQTKGRFKRQRCYARSSTDVSERGRPRDFRLWHIADDVLIASKVGYVSSFSAATYLGEWPESALPRRSRTAR